MFSTCGYMDGCICLSSEFVEPDLAKLSEAIAARASGRLSSSSWLKLNCRTSRFRRLLLESALGFILSGVGLRVCLCGVLSAVRLDVAESCDELRYLSLKVSLELFPCGVNGASLNAASIWALRMLL